MESSDPGSEAEVVVSRPDGSLVATVPLVGARVSVGRLPANDIVLEPDPELLVSRIGHCTLEQEGLRWFLVDGGSVNGTYVGRGGERRRVHERTPLHDGDVVGVLASAGAGGRRFFELAFHQTLDSQATRAVDLDEPAAECISYDASEARLVLVRNGERYDIPIRAQAHRLVRYMMERNAAAGGSPVLCTHADLMRAVWADEPMHTREELAKLMWELRKKLEPFGAAHLIENERRLGYRLRTCRG